MREQLAFTVGSNEVVVSHAHGIECQEVSSQTPAETHSNGTLELYLRECCWTISPVLKQRGERQRESSKSMLMCFLARERSLAV